MLALLKSIKPIGFIDKIVPAVLACKRRLLRAPGHARAFVGNGGLTRKYPLQRHYRDVLGARAYAPRDDSILAAPGGRPLAAVTATVP
jgi:alkylation response protein AidB-like acyl-CoA dehydrogenase